MTLTSYNNKRNFKNTPEPHGKINNTPKRNMFVVQFHNATTTHYDFRLQYNGVLLSWAIPKGPSFNPSVSRLAVRVEDHPVNYINFEGVIPNGNYGAGSVEIFDFGNYTPIQDFKTGLKNGHLKFILSGNVLKGAWSLIKTSEKNWILKKIDDQYANKKPQMAKKLTNPFNSCNVHLATLTNIIPKGKSWAFEIKYDGYRIVAFAENKKVKLISRGQKNYTSIFNEVAESIKIVAKDVPMVLDGEVVCFDKDGKSNFGLLQNNIKQNAGGFCFVVFDILAYAGKDLRGEELKTRKDYLQKVLINCPPNIIYSSHVLGSGSKCFNLAKKLNLEGIIAKKINSKYLGIRDENWLKIKCYKRQEFVIIGFLTSEKNKELSALIVGYYKNNNLIYAGKVGTGFNASLKSNLRSLFTPLVIKTNNIKNYPTNLKNVKLLKPKLVAEIKYAEFTQGGVLRQPSFVGLRQDKPAKSVVLEENNE